MNGTHCDAVTDRLDRLERDVRRWKIAGRTALTFLGLVFLLGATVAKIPDEIRAKRFIVTDKDGKKRVELSMGSDVAPGLFLWGKDGKVRASIADWIDGTVRLNLNDQSGRNRVNLTLLDSGSPILRFLDEGTSLRTTLATSGLAFLDKEGKGRAFVGVSDEGWPTLVLFDQDGRTKVEVSDFPPNGASLIFRDKEGKPLLWTGIMADGSVSVGFTDKSGRVRNVLSEEYSEGSRSGRTWVLWGQAILEASIEPISMGAWFTRRECEEQRSQRERTRPEGKASGIIFACLPDTMNLRKPQ